MKQASNLVDIIDHRDEFGANEQRGMTKNPDAVPAHEMATEFIKQYPLGSILTPKEFDEFIISKCGVAPPTCTDTGSEGWLAFLQRRFQTKMNINKASSHPRMRRYGIEAFTIEQDGRSLKVVSTHEAIANTKIAKDVSALVDVKYKKLRYLMESVDFSVLPPEMMGQVRNLVEHIDDFKAQLDFSTSRMTIKFNTLAAEIRHRVQIGAITPQNGGIKALTDNTNDGLPEFLSENS